MSPTHFASFLHPFASFPHQISFIPPPKRFIFLTNEQKIDNILGSCDLQWLCLMLGLVRASKVTLVAIVWLLIVWLHCAFSNVSSKRVHRMMQSHIGCICLTFLRCVFSKVSSNCIHVRMQIYIGCNYLTFLQCAFSNVSSNHLPYRKHSHNRCICLA